MLTYHPAFDLYSAIFRFLRLLDPMRDRTVELERLRILDFYLLFPFLLADIQFPASAIAYKKYFKKKPTDYENISDPKRLFLRLRQFLVAEAIALLTESRM